MSDVLSIQSDLRALAAEAARVTALAASASSVGLFNKFAAIEACRANPYQPFLVWHPTALGSLMQLDLRERVAQEIFLFGAFEPDLLWFFACVVEPGWTFFDCGAHIGFFSLAAGMLVGPDGRVDAFEPVASTKMHLDTNIRNAKLTNVFTHPIALWSAPTTIQLQDFGHALSAYNSVASPRLAPGTPLPKATSLQVPATSLDAFVASSKRMPNVVKIDVESAEDHVVQGMKRILQEARPIVTIEVGDFEHAANDDVAPSRVPLERLEEAKYELFELEACRLVPHKIRASEPYGYGNIVAIPKERADDIVKRTTAVL